MKLLIVRPQPGANATAKRVQAAGFDPIVMPLFAIEPVDWTITDPNDHDALMITSANALRMAGEKLKQLSALPAYAVGSATAAALRDAGHGAAFTGDSGVQELLAMAMTNGHRKLLWLAGEDRTEAEIPETMALICRTVYRSAEIAAPPLFGEKLQAADAVLVHSVRAARYLAQLCDANGVKRSMVRLAALSVKIAAAAGPGWRTTIAADQPTDATLLSALQRHFTTHSRDP